MTLLLNNTSPNVVKFVKLPILGVDRPIGVSSISPPTSVPEKIPFSIKPSILKFSSTKLLVEIVSKLP